MNSLPPTFNSAKFNTLAFNSGGYLTKSQADLLYLPYSTWNLLNSTPGVVTANKAVIVDGNKDIATFRNMYATKFFGDNIDINNNGSLNLYGSTNSVHLHSTTAADILLDGDISNTLTFGGTSGFILMQGNSQYITMEGTGNYLKISNTAHSTSSTTGAIRSSGGIYVGGNSLFGANITSSGVILSNNTTNTNNSTNNTQSVNINGGVGINGNLYANLGGSSSFAFGDFGANKDGNGSYGICRMLCFSSVAYIQAGSSFTAYTSIDLFIGDMGVGYTVSNRINMFKASGNVGFGTYSPNKQLAINNSTGQCLRLIYNSKTGSETNYADLLMSSGGNLTISPTGGTLIVSAGLNISGAITSTNDITSSGTIIFTKNEASVASGSGTIRCTGGAYFGNDSYFENMLTIKKRLYFKTTTVFNMLDSDTCDLYGTHFHAQGAVGTGTQQSITAICFSAVSGISNDHTPAIAITFNKLSNFQGDLLFKAKVAGGQTGSCVEMMRIKGATGDLNVLYNLDLTNFNGSSVGLKLAGTLITASATEINYNDITTLGTSQASKVITTNASNNTSLGGNITFTGTNTITSSTQDLTINMGTTAKKLIISNNTGANGEICRFQANSSTASLSINMGTADVDIYTNSVSYGMSFSVNNTPSTPHIWLVNNVTAGNKQQVSINSRNGQWAQLNVNCNADTRNESGYYIGQRWYHTLTGIKSTALAICDLQIEVASPYMTAFGTYTNTPFVLQTNNTGRMFFQTSGNCSIGGDVDRCPLYIDSTSAYTLSSFGVLTKSILSVTSTVYSNNTTYINHPISLWTVGSIVSENLIFQYSDRRLKENINVLNLEKCLSFMNINAHTFNYKGNKKPSVGFIAQDVVKTEFFNHLINLLPSEIEEDYDSPENFIFALSMDSIVPIHHTILKSLISENKKLKRRLDFLEEKINSLI